MTTEEIEREITIELAGHMARYRYSVGDGLRPLQELVTRLVLSRVSRAYEEAARMACGHCLNRRQLEQRGEFWHHPAESYWPESRCHAGGIHALKALLAQETVST